MERVYASIDLKSFYASVECMERGLDPLTTNLVVADSSRTEKTICLAVSPSLKKYGIPGRARLFEVNEKVRNVNFKRRLKANNNKFIGKSYDDTKLENNNSLELDFIIAKPRMAYYMKYSTDIYNVYLKYISPDDIFSYSIDEVFCDLTSYLKTYNVTAKELVSKIIMDVYRTTGITATAGIGTNMFLCKVAMDILAKHAEPDCNGVRIAILDERSFRKKLWSHTPITDFWRVGKGYSKSLERYGIYTMGDVARCSILNEDLLYRLFGVNAELLIDHSWGWECTTISDIKRCKPESKSISSGQVLSCPYNYEKSRLILKEMVDLLVLDMVGKKYLTDMLVLTVDYDVENLKYNSNFNGKLNEDRYGRMVPKPAHGTFRLENMTSSTMTIMDGFLKLFDKIVNKDLLIRKINICVGNLLREDKISTSYEQLDFFTDIEEKLKQDEKLQKEKKLQETVICIKNKYGKNAIIKAFNLEEGATTLSRNKQIGGHSE